MILGIDYGLRNIGLATSEGSLAEPYGTVYNVSGIKNVVAKLGITKVVVGISEGKSKDRAIGFGKKLKNMLGLPVEFVDETLTTVEANSLRKQSKPKKIQEHARAAAIILQRYLDSSH